MRAMDNGNWEGWEFRNGYLVDPRGINYTRDDFENARLFMMAGLRAELRQLLDDDTSVEALIRVFKERKQRHSI